MILPCGRVSNTILSILHRANNARQCKCFRKLELIESKLEILWLERWQVIIEHLVKIKNMLKLLFHIGNRMDDLKASIESGVEGINIFSTVNKQRLDAMSCSLEQYLEKLRGLVLLAKELNLEVRASFNIGDTASTKEVTREVVKN